MASASDSFEGVDIACSINPRRHCRDRQAHWRTSGRADSASNLDREFTVNRSPHVTKKSMEHFEIRTHSGCSTSSSRLRKQWMN